MRYIQFAPVSGYGNTSGSFRGVFLKAFANVAALDIPHRLGRAGLNRVELL